MTALLGDIARVLASGGRLVITYRDLTRPLCGTDRFIPVRSTEDRLLTCFLEYLDQDTVIVHDLLHTRSGGSWVLQASSYPKLRISPGWLGDRCHAVNLKIQHGGTGPRGMHTVLATKA